MDCRVLRAPWIVAVVVAWVLGGCTGGCDSESDGSPSANGEKQAKGALQKGSSKAGVDGGAAGKPSGSGPPPGWDATISGPVRGTVEGPSVLRKHAGMEGQEQIVLAGLPTGGEGPEDQLSLTVATFEDGATKTYSAAAVEAYFGSMKLACSHPVEADTGQRTKMRVEVTHFTNARFQGEFEGTLYCESTVEDDEDKPEPVWVEVSGQFVDR